MRTQPRTICACVWHWEYARLPRTRAPKHTYPITAWRRPLYTNAHSQTNGVSFFNSACSKHMLYIRAL